MSAPARTRILPPTSRDPRRAVPHWNLEAPAQGSSPAAKPRRLQRVQRFLRGRRQSEPGAAIANRQRLIGRCPVPAPWAGSSAVSLRSREGMDGKLSLSRSLRVQLHCCNVLVCLNAQARPHWKAEAGTSRAIPLLWADLVVAGTLRPGDTGLGFDNPPACPLSFRAAKLSRVATHCTG